MKTLFQTFACTLAALLLLNGTGAAFAQEADNHEPLKELMQKNSCTACHYIDKRKYGPTFIEMSQKYQNADQATLDKLLTKMREGGAGVWGEDPMPPQPQLSQEEAQQMLKLILALKPQTK